MKPEKKMGLDPEKVPKSRVEPFDMMLTPTQREAVLQGGRIESRTEGLGYPDLRDHPLENEVSVNTTSVSPDADQIDEIDETSPAPPEFEEGGQATVDELKEINLGD